MKQTLKQKVTAKLANVHGNNQAKIKAANAAVIANAERAERELNRQLADADDDILVLREEKKEIEVKLGQSSSEIIKTNIAIKKLKREIEARFSEMKDQADDAIIDTLLEGANVIDVLSQWTRLNSNDQTLKPVKELFNELNILEVKLSGYGTDKRLVDIESKISSLEQRKEVISQQLGKLAELKDFSFDESEG